MRVCLFEDRAVLNLDPLVLTRPVFDLLCGQCSLGQKQFRHFAAADQGLLVRPFLADLCRLQQPNFRVNNLPWLRSDSVILVNGRWLPPLEKTVAASTPCVGLVGGEVAYVQAGPRELAAFSPGDLEPYLEEWKNRLPRRAAGGCLVRYPWDLVRLNEQELHADYQPQPLSGARDSLPLALVGPAENLRVDPSARIDPFVVADTLRGPVVIDREAVVLSFSRLEGPCYIGPRTQILGARIRGGTTIGPNCRV